MKFEIVGQQGDLKPAIADEWRHVEPQRTHQLAALECGTTARSLLRARARRRDYFEPSIFSEPAWDILLELFVAYAAQRRIQVSAVGAAALIPQTTMLRWLRALDDRELIERADDPCDARRTYVSISEKGAMAMMQYIRSLQDRRPI